MSDILVGLSLAALAAFFGAHSYGQLKARLTDRVHLFAPKVGHRRPGSVRLAVVFGWLSLLFAGAAILSFGHLAGLVDYEAADE